MLPFRATTALLFLLFSMLYSRAALAQSPDSSFWAQHTFARSDSALAADTVLFPRDTISQYWTYTRTKKTPGSSSSTLSYESQGWYHSAYITLFPDFSFVYRDYFEVGETLTFGKWNYEPDSTIRLQWDGVRSVRAIRNEKIIRKYFSYPFNHPGLTRIENWHFMKRAQQLTAIRD